MRVFSIVGLLISLLIVGWLSASYLTTVTGAASPAPGDDANGMSVTVSPVDRAREIVSIDQERQKQMEEFLKQHK
ncbi:MAG: hypothetical protein LBL73_05720 [Synergistaceae bacterium]|jgi:hypothetical protein|nr:hypothetical protein [Synergistaceae bacterium]